ncbi:MAG: tRNA 2-selenouridine(34) synthase MnmH [Paracoccaceae bacterium]|nr:tRNA 2-selenouridine(34) synthase MnmH [Paracoccaceae bacterium]
MPLELRTVAEAVAHGFDDVLDVRSPAEFAEDRMPGAINLPALDNDERARVGTIYKQESPFRARKIGAALLARNAAAHIEGPLADRDGGWRPLVYCWRGGQRSGAFASILREIGWRVETVAGGYRRWRRLVVAALYDAPVPARVVLLDGNTGTAKTRLLALLAARGTQVIDLEDRAGHRGSILGALGPQPSQKAFESALAVDLARLDPARPVILEAESATIGRLTLPPALVAAMRQAPRIEIAAPLDARADFLVETYGEALSDPRAFAARLRPLTRLRGRATVERWVEMAEAGDWQPLAAELMALHYDPAYAKSRARRGGAPLAVLEAKGLGPADLEALAGEIAARVSAV